MHPKFKYPTQNTNLPPNTCTHTRTHTHMHTHAPFLPAQHFNVSLVNKQQRPLQPALHSWGGEGGHCVRLCVRLSPVFACTCVFVRENAVGKSASKGARGMWKWGKKGVFVSEWGLPGLCWMQFSSSLLRSPGRGEWSSVRMVCVSVIGVKASEGERERVRERDLWYG